MKMTANVPSGDGGSGAKVGGAEAPEHHDVPVSLELIKQALPKPGEKQEFGPPRLSDTPDAIKPIDLSELTPRVEVQLPKRPEDDLTLGLEQPTVPPAPVKPAGAPAGGANDEQPRPPATAPEGEPKVQGGGGADAARPEAAAANAGGATSTTPIMAASENAASPRGGGGGSGAAGVDGGSLTPDPANVPPEYPAAAKRRGIEGVTVLRLTIDPDGRVSDVSIHSSSGHDVLDREAVRKVSRWRYVRNDGGKTTVTRYREVKFALRG